QCEPRLRRGIELHDAAALGLFRPLADGGGAAEGIRHRRSEPMILSAGTRLGPYQIESVPGAGGFGGDARRSAQASRSSPHDRWNARVRWNARLEPSDPHAGTLNIVLN